MVGRGEKQTPPAFGWPLKQHQGHPPIQEHHKNTTLRTQPYGYSPQRQSRPSPWAGFKWCLGVAGRRWGWSGPSRHFGMLCQAPAPSQVLWVCSIALCLWLLCYKCCRSCCTSLVCEQLCLCREALQWGSFALQAALLSTLTLNMFCHCVYHCVFIISVHNSVGLWKVLIEV